VTVANGTDRVGASPATVGARAGFPLTLCLWDEGGSSPGMPLTDGYSCVCFWPWTLVGEATALGQLPAAPRDPRMLNVG